MICWDRVGNDMVIGVFEPGEVALLRRHLLKLREALEQRFAEYTMDLVLGERRPDAMTDDPRLGELLAFRARDDEPDEVRLWREPAVFGTSHHMIEMVLATLPTDKALVEIRSFEQVFAWLWALTDVRVALTPTLAEFGGIEQENAGGILFTLEWLHAICHALRHVTFSETQPVAAAIANDINAMDPSGAG
jgi:hypothetical protein